MQMRHKVEIYIPANTLIQIVFVKKTAKTFAKVFGGATTADVAGTWIDDAGNAVDDKIKIVYSYAESLNKSMKDSLRDFAGMICHELNEDVILLVMDGIAELIPPHNQR